MVVGVIRGGEDGVRVVMVVVCGWYDFKIASHNGSNALQKIQMAIRSRIKRSLGML